MGVKYYTVFGYRYAMRGWVTTYTGTGYDKGLGFDLMCKVLEIGWPAKESWRWRPFFRIVTDIRVET